jgi:hypothetical protein
MLAWKAFVAGQNASRNFPDGYRRSLIRRFLYAVFFESSHERITIYAGFHTSRDPKKWRQCLP